MSLHHLVPEILTRYAAPLRPMDVVESLGNADGLSGAALWRYQSPGGPICVRAWPSGSLGRSHLEQVHRWLAKARPLGFIPVPFQGLDGESLQELGGTFWELAPWMPGAPETVMTPSSTRAGAAFSALARFHRTLEDERSRAISPGLTRRFALVRNLESGGLQAIENAIETALGDLPERNRLARQWLALARAAVPRLIEPLALAAREILPVQPCVRDARAVHFLFTEDRLTGLVDFGSMGVDCVAGDLARLMGDWFAGDANRRAEAVAAYRRIRPLEPAELAVMGLFESSADLLVGERWIAWHYLEKRYFSQPNAVLDGIGRGVNRLNQHGCSITGESGDGQKRT